MKKIVNGYGNLNSSLIIIGEAPGEKEESAGVPFLGPSGMVLAEALQQADTSREDVYLTNAVKFRPDNNKTPSKTEILRFKPLLLEEIKLVKPEVVLCLGAVASKIFMGDTFKITRDRGTMMPTPQGFCVVSTFHPACVLRHSVDVRVFIEDVKYAVREANGRREKSNSHR